MESLPAIGVGIITNGSFLETRLRALDTERSSGRAILNFYLDIFAHPQNLRHKRRGIQPEEIQRPRSSRFPIADIHDDQQTTQRSM
jgi:hypothetical protein